MDKTLRRDTKHIGDLSELIAMCELAKMGYHVAIPFGENTRWDCIIVKGGVLSRVQIKTGRLRNGVVRFNCYSSHVHRGGPARKYTDDVDYFAVYCRDLDSVYLIPIEDLKVTEGWLRVDAPRNGQSKKIRYADNYCINRPCPRPLPLQLVTEEAM